jgi:energy-coupling factor transporter ATP-binding protein EcfA2
VDFYHISTKEMKDGTSQVFPDWIVGRSKDLMVRGQAFYAVWDEAAGLWSTDEYDVQRLVDEDLHRYVADRPDQRLRVMRLQSFNSNIWVTFRRYLKSISDSHHVLDEKLTFANTEVKKSDYVSKRLPYSLERGTTHAWDELIGVLYDDEERAKIEWAIGSVVSGDSRKIQKFLVFYGPAGSGKSTVLNIIQSLFQGYTSTFDAKALGNSNSTFSTEVFKGNPLVAVQHDGDLSRIEDNTKLNSIISHEEMTMNEKFKASYSARVNAFLFMGTNQPVKISDAKSGIIRRLIDVHPTGKKVEPERYHLLMNQIEFELGAIAQKCLETYQSMGKNYYNTYKPLEMMLQTDVFYNYVESYFDIFKAQDGISLRQGYAMYKEFCADSNVPRVMPQYKFREELRNYFHEFHDQIEIDGVIVRSYYQGFKFGNPQPDFVPDDVYSIELKDGLESAFDRAYGDQPAQYSKASGHPGKKWENVTTVLDDLDTAKLHFVKVPTQHIVIDFDLVDEDGEKDLALNLEAAAKLPPTYTELSRSEKGVHLHYLYTGDPSTLDSIFGVGIEVKTLLGDSALRRKLTKCNGLDIAYISGGLPKKEKRMIENKTIQSEKTLRDLIERNLRKEIHPGTKPSVDFIYKILDDAYKSDMAYDVQDLRGRVLSFAASSTNHAAECIKVVQRMNFISKRQMPENDGDDGPITFFDVEVYPNLFVVCWRTEGQTTVTRMINPDPYEIEQILQLKLVGFNNRRYDNHILYARLLGYSNEGLFDLSQKIIDGRTSAMFGEAYNISYADIYDFSSKKQSLKKFEVELGIHHLELDIPWDEPVPTEKWKLVEDYCVNDVIATQAVFEARKQDFVARQILADLSGLAINNTTQAHTAKIIFGDDKNPQREFVYTDLSRQFKGYKFDGKESTYKGEVVGEGGYVYAEPGYYENVALLDVASMHPTSIEQLELFGRYTPNFSALKQARMAIKHKDYERAGSMLDGRLGKFLGNDMDVESLAYALKIVINIVYGLTSARFANPFRDNRNVDNIVAKRGALFMIDLKKAVQKQGFIVAHIKTDSIKIPNATPEIIQFVIDFGKEYGYDFEHEVTYDKFCLTNDAVYIARAGSKWTAVGAQFQHPYVYKKLFTQDEVVFDDYCEAKSVVQGRMYLDFHSADSIQDMVHVGRTGSFVPVTYGGGVLWRVKDDRKYHVSGTKDHLWVERDVAESKYKDDDLYIDMAYFEKLREEAFDAVDFFVPFNRFIGE